MRIANNVLGMTIHRMYNINLKQMQKSMMRLASGYRINSAADDAAGLAISERMRAQMRGLNMATRNSQDGVSLIQTAEGSLDRVHAILGRMKELAVQSATGTNQTLDRHALQQEFNQLREEINDIARDGTFNDMNLFDGSLTGKIGGTAGTIAGANTGAVGNVTINGSFTVSQTGNYWIEATDEGVKLIRDALELDFKTWDELGISDTGNGNTTLSFGLTQQGTTIDIEVSGDKADIMTDLNGVKFNVKNTAKGAYNDVGLVLQVGAKEGNTLAVSIDEMSSFILGLDEVDISTQAGAGSAITAVDKAINQVSSQRSYLGAIQNRLEYKIENLTNQSLNLADAESRIRDVDYALEMMNFVRAQIQMQVAMAMMAQTNSMAQNVLHLLNAG